jgi:hypothetical protein
METGEGINLIVYVSPELGCCLAALIIIYKLLVKIVSPDFATKAYRDAKE